MAVDSSRSVDWAAQVEHLDQATWTKVKVFPVSLTPWARWIKVGATTDGPLKGLVMFMPEAFFETHGEDGLPLPLAH